MITQLLRKYLSSIWKCWALHCTNKVNRGVLSSSIWFKIISCVCEDIKCNLNYFRYSSFMRKHAYIQTGIELVKNDIFVWLIVFIVLLFICFAIFFHFIASLYNFRYIIYTASVYNYIILKTLILIIFYFS